MKNIVTQTIALHFVAAAVFGQNLALTGEPFAPRGKSKSPDGNYEWIVKTLPAVRYELINLGTKNAIATVSSYYPDPDETSMRYANAVGVYWNQDSSVVALDELNRRRAGHLFFFALSGGTAHEYRAEQFVVTPKTADEARFVVDPGWISSTKIRIRLATKTRESDSTSKFFLIDFSNPNAPQVQLAH
jgi:hypothetical protein